MHLLKTQYISDVWNSNIILQVEYTYTEEKIVDQDKDIFANYRRMMSLQIESIE